MRVAGPAEGRGTQVHTQNGERRHEALQVRRLNNDVEVTRQNKAEAAHEHGLEHFSG